MYKERFCPLLNLYLATISLFCSFCTSETLQTKDAFTLGTIDLPRNYCSLPLHSASTLVGGSEDETGVGYRNIEISEGKLKEEEEEEKNAIHNNDIKWIDGVPRSHSSSARKAKHELNLICLAHLFYFSAYAVM